MAGKPAARVAVTQALDQPTKACSTKKRRTSKTGHWPGRRPNAKPRKKVVSTKEVDGNAPQTKRANVPQRAANVPNLCRQVASRRDVASRDTSGGRQTDLLSFGFSSSVACRQQESDKSSSFLGPTQMWANSVSPVCSPTQPAVAIGALENAGVECNAAQACSPTQLVTPLEAQRQLQAPSHLQPAIGSRACEMIEARTEVAWPRESTRTAVVAEQCDAEDDLLGPTQLWGAALQAMSPSPSPSPPQRPSRSLVDIAANARQTGQARSPSPTASFRQPSPKKDLSLQKALPLEISPTQELCLEHRLPDNISPTQPWNEP